MSRPRMKRSRTHINRKDPRSRVFFDDGKESENPGWAVRWKDEVLSPRWLSAGAAQAHLDGLHRKEKEAMSHG